MVTEYSLKISAFTVEALHGIKSRLDEDGSDIDAFDIRDEKRPYWFEATAFDEDETVHAGPTGVFAALEKDFPGVSMAITFVSPRGFGILTSSFERRLKILPREDSANEATDELFEIVSAGEVKTSDIRSLLARHADMNALVAGHSFFYRLANHNPSLIEYCIRKGMRALGPLDDPVVIAQAVMENAGRGVRKTVANILIGEVAYCKSNVSLMNDAVKSNDRYAASAAALRGLNAGSYIAGHAPAEAWLKKVLPLWVAA